MHPYDVPMNGLFVSHLVHHKITMGTPKTQHRSAPVGTHRSAPVGTPGASHHALEKLFGFLRVAAGLQDLCQLALAIPRFPLLFFGEIQEEMMGNDGKIMENDKKMKGT